MADVFYTILVIWVLWRIFGGTTKSNVTHRHYYEQPGRNEGEIKISSTPQKDKGKNANEGEYVDYEEIK